MDPDRFDVKGQGENCNVGNVNRPARHVRRSTEAVYFPRPTRTSPKNPRSRRFKMQMQRLWAIAS